MATYPGNPSVASAVKDRVVSTFRQTLALYKQGRTDEVNAGCNLILQMDPMFDPARRLMQKVQNPAASIDVDNLLPADVGPDALQEARAAMAARDFQRVIQLTTEILTDDLMNDEARILGDEAREKQEAAPFIDQFARKCEQHLGAGNLPAARQDLEKARSLDGDNPTIAQMEQRIAAAASGGAAPAASSAAPAQAPGFSFDATPSFVIDSPSPAAPGSSRAAAQASDFGFTFEEDKPTAAKPSGATAPQQPSDPFAAFAAPSDGSFSFESPAGSFSPDSKQPSAKPATPPAAAPAKPATPPAAAPFSFDSSATPAEGFSSFSFDTPSSNSGSFSFDSAHPSIPGEFNFGAKAPATGEFDFSASSGPSSADDQQKIQQYLDEGDREFTSGNYQQAIDLWSRIFLIDVTNEQASERIERAKGKRREIDQKVDDILAGGVHAFNRKDYDAARPRFNEVLRLDPTNATARDYMTRLAAAAAGPAPTAPAAAPVTSGSFDAFPHPFDEETPAIAPLVPPDIPLPGAAAEPKTKTSAAPKTRSARRIPTTPLIAVVVIAVLAAAGWFAWTRFSSHPDQSTTGKTVIAQATKLAQHGQYDAAVALLQDVKPDDPMHDRAMSMIADLQRRGRQASERIDGRPVEQFLQEHLTAARAAFDGHDYDQAKKEFEQAQRARPLAPDMQQIYNQASQQVAKLDAAKALFKQGQYDGAIASLTPILQQDPQNKSVQRMILDAHFNLGAKALQDERLPDAMQQFDEVLKADPTDELAKKSKDLAARYNGQPKDLLYKIYVKYLPLRQAA